jgi:hypothetical protein
MVTIASLWLPIVLAAAIVFIASSLIHMLPLWHRSDYAPVPREAEVQAALRPLAPPPGEYFLPFTSDMKELKSQGFQEKLRAGPVAMLTVLPNGPLSMGTPLLLWFLYLLLVGLFVAVIAAGTLGPGTPYPRVFRVTAALAFGGYALALLQNSIWGRRSWVVTLKSCFDGLIYAALTAGTFGWLWPH